MEYKKNIEQELKVLYENKINYQVIDYTNEIGSEYKDKNKIKSIEEFFKRIESLSGIILIIGNNGIGKSYLLEQLYKNYNQKRKKVNFIKLKDFTELDNLIKKCTLESDYIIFDGLDEINENIQSEILEYIFGIKNKKVIVSSRKDFATKRELIDFKFNIYEIEQLNDNEVNKVLADEGIEKEKYKKIYNILKIPRFLISLLEVKDEVSGNINKYDLLEMIFNKNLEKLKERTTIKIEINIHKKILQTLALIMMMTGKVNLTMEEFTTFLSNIEHLDIKSYILNKDIIETFLNNQVLMNNGNVISFENKEIMEFLAAKEIYENSFSNKELFDIVTIKNSKEIDSFWFNTLSYLVCKSKIYYELILNFTFKNLSQQDSLLDFLMNIDYNQDANNLVVEKINSIISQYTKLYQYMSFHEYETNEIYEILCTNPKECLKKIVDILIEQRIGDNMSKIDIIYINNILTCIYVLIRNFDCTKTEIKKLKNYFIKYKDLYIQNNNFKVRYMYIIIKILEPSEIDEIIESSNIDKRLLSILLYDNKHVNNLKNLDKYVNNYILNYKKKSDDNFILGNSRVIEFVNNNYNLKRMKNLLNGIENEANIISFICFADIKEFEDLKPKLIEKSIASLLYEKIIKELLTDNLSKRKEFEKNIIFYNKSFRGLMLIVDPCIKYKYINVECLNDDSLNDSIAFWLRMIIIKELIEENNDVKELYNFINDKNRIFIVWKTEIDSEVKEKLEPQIKKLFPIEYKNYIKEITKYKNKDYVEIEKLLISLKESDNIYYKIGIIEDIIREADNRFIKIKRLELINNDKILRNSFNSIIREILNYVVNINPDKIIYGNQKNNSNQIDFDTRYYSDAIYILSKSGYNINEYNDKNILLLCTIEDINPTYTAKDYNTLLEHIKNKNAQEYIKENLYYIIDKLKQHHKKETFEIVFDWLDNIEFDEHQINIVSGFILENIKFLKKSDYKKLEKFRKYKLCQDILIELGYKEEIKNRIDYIKNNLIFEDDIETIEQKTNFEYSEEIYISPLAKIGVKNKKYIIELVSFMFEKYNKGDYYYFSKYIMSMVVRYINNNQNNVDDLIDFIITKEKENNNRYLYEICKTIASLRKKDNKNIIEAINEYNNIITNQYVKIYSYDDLYNEVKEILETRIFDDIKRMRFLEIFRDKNTKKINPLLEETYQFLIGYELNRILILEGYNTKTIYESTAYDKKRNDIQLITEGFIQDIVIETKLSNNSDISNEENIKSYINTKLEDYRREFNVSKILFVIINQKLLYETCQKKIDLINKNSNDKIDTILIDLKEGFK